jgi:dihydroorotate dehydrogenase
MAKSCLKKSIIVLPIVIASVGLLFAFNNYVRDTVRSSKAYWYLADNVATPLLRRLDPETAHNLAIKMIDHDLAPMDVASNSSLLQTTVWGLNFTNPLGVAAGFDKQAQAMQGLLQMGFGFVEVGGVTPLPQAGNPKPRMFRLTEDSAVINRYGLNSDGQDIVAGRLSRFKNQAQAHGVVGVNIAKNTTSEDLIGEYKKGVQNFASNVDFIVLNVSCPNVAWTKELSKDGDELASMVCAVKEERDHLANSKPPLLLKLGPDMSMETKQHMAEIAMHCGVDGLIVSNTTSNRANDLKSANSKETGGLSGRPIKQAALQSLKDMYRLTNGKLPIIGVGGIETGQEAYERIRAGASLVQIYTAMVYQGPGIVPQIKQDLAQLLQRDGFNSVAAAVGVDADKVS